MGINTNSISLKIDILNHIKISNVSNRNDFDNIIFDNNPTPEKYLETFTGKKIASVDDVRSAIKSFCGDAEQTSGSENTDSHVGTINISTIIEMFNNGETTPTQNLLLLLNPEILSTNISDLPSTDS